MSMATAWLARDGGRVADPDVVIGPMVVRVPGIGDIREGNRSLTPELVRPGGRVAEMDPRIHGVAT